MSRRGLLYAGTAAAVLILAGAGVAVVARAGEPDAVLLALCATFHRAHAEAGDKQDAVKELFRMVPATEAGHRAKATVAASLLADLDEHETRGGDPETRFAAKAFRDWLQVSA